MLCHNSLFYGVCVGKVVGKVTRERGCCMANIGIRCYDIFRETFSKWTCKFVFYIIFVRGVWGVYVILNDKVGWFKFWGIDNEFYLFLRFLGFNVFFVYCWLLPTRLFYSFYVFDSCSIGLSY